ncbi:MAG: class I SAM-dependent methyltransferase [Pseudanabaenaceae cyanobacterium SKYGB_i_bin29]|nr:class I SAM-dependent methyltransferase [Pseudanabaenaceae cyanobacterium SKYG29]MDW8422117.1 class I SAM-dependent methyltransferase [Pseudanabaenaceae cyanobacterium SKYGB_i_bin29]
MSDLVRQVDQVAIDWTKFFNYPQLVAEEIAEYSTTEITDRLLLGGIHDQPAWRFWFQFLEKQWGTHFGREVIDFANQLEQPRLLSLGCGHGGFELEIASKLTRPYQLIAVDLNPHIWDEAIRRAKAQNLAIEFQPIDLNFVEIAPHSFDVIFAHASLHHILNLEHLMAQIYHALKPGGRFIVLDMIGEVQTLFWQENVDFARKLVEEFPPRFRARFQENPIPPYQPPSVQVGMEGIRQEELETEIDRLFVPVKCFKYNSFMRLIGTNPVLGNLFNLDDKDDREFLESLCWLDWEQVYTGKLCPTEMFGVYEKKEFPPCHHTSQARLKFVQTLLQQPPQLSPSIPQEPAPPVTDKITDWQVQIYQELLRLNELVEQRLKRTAALEKLNQQLQQYIDWMQSSKFWRLRQFYKSLFNGKNPDPPRPQNSP